MKQVDSKTNRMVMIGLYSKGTDGQMYTSSFILCEILILHTLEEENIMHIYIKDKKLIKEQAKVCMTAKKKTTYCPVIWTHITLARCYVRKYKYMQL